MIINRLGILLLGAVLFLGQSLFAADPPEPANDPLPEGAKARFGTSRPILRNSPGVGLVPPTFTNFLAPTLTGAARRYDLGTGRPLERRGLIGPGQVVVSEDGKRAVVSRPGALTVVNVATGDQIMAAKPPEGVVIVGTPGASLSADGKRLAYGGRGKDGKGWIVVCNVDKNEVLAQFETIHVSPVFPTISRDGATVISHGPPALPPSVSAKAPMPVVPVPNQEVIRTAQVWEAATGEELCQIRLTGMGGMVVAAAFTPDGKLGAVSGGDGPIDLFDVRTGKRVNTLLGRLGQGVRLAISPDGKTIASVGPDYRIQRWTIDGKPLGITDAPSGIMIASITGLSFVDNDRVIAWLTAQQFAVAWEAPSGKLLTPATEHIAEVRDISFAEGTRELFTSGRDGHVLSWNQADGRLTDTINLHPARLHGQPLLRPIVNLSADATRAVWLRTPIEVFDLVTGADLHSIPPPSTPQGLVKMSTSKDVMKVITISRQAPREKAWSCVIWDLTTQKRFAEFDVPGPATGVMVGGDLSPRQERIAIIYTARNQGGQEVLVTAGFDLKSGKRLAELEQSNLSGTITMMPADETSIVFASTTGRLWHADYTTGRIGEDIDNLPTRADAGPVTIIFSRDGKRFAIAIVGDQPETYSVRVYDWAKKKALHTFTGHRGPVSTLRFSPDGKFLASGSQDTSVLLWDLSKLPASK